MPTSVDASIHALPWASPTSGAGVSDTGGHITDGLGFQLASPEPRGWTFGVRGMGQKQAVSRYRVGGFFIR